MKNLKKSEGLFSFYKAPITNTIPAAEITLLEVYQAITSPDKYKRVTIKLRNAIDKEVQSSIKKNHLDYVTVSATFKERTANGLIKHSGLICLDIDDISPTDELKKKIISLLPPALLFVSPSGNGIKVVYKVDITMARHLDYFEALRHFFKNELNIEIDHSCKDIPRACFLCYDADAYYNDDSEILDDSFIDTFHLLDGMQSLPQGGYTDLEKIEKLLTWLDKKESFISGNRNNYISQLAAACNRFGVPKTETEAYLLTYEQPDFTAKEISTTVRSIYNKTAYHGTEEFVPSSVYTSDDPTVEETKAPSKKTPLLPIDGFPDFIKSIINEYTDVYSGPRDYIASSLLFATAFAIGDRFKLKTKYENIPLMWLCIVGNVSIGKTAPLSFCLDYFIKKDEAAFEQYALEKSEFDANQQKSKRERDSNMEKPTYKQYILKDYTPESIAPVHSINSRGLCVYRDELKGWFEDFGRYNNSGEQSNMLSGWYSLPMIINRKGSDPIFIPKPIIYVSGGIQEDLIFALAKDNRGESGFMSRIMFAYPDLALKMPYSEEELSPEFKAKLHQYLDVLCSLTDETELSLSGGAKAAYRNWYDENANKSNDEPSNYLKGVYGKLDVISLRLAITIHGMKYVCNQNSNIQISEETMTTALEITEYFRTTAEKVYSNIFNKKDKTSDKKELIKALHQLGNSQTEIASIVGCTQPYVSKILKGL